MDEIWLTSTQWRIAFVIRVVCNVVLEVKLMDTWQIWFFFDKDLSFFYGTMLLLTSSSSFVDFSVSCDTFFCCSTHDIDEKLPFRKKREKFFAIEFRSLCFHVKWNADLHSNDTLDFIKAIKENSFYRYTIDFETLSRRAFYSTHDMTATKRFFLS